MHMAIHAMPLNFALKFNIPLILWGENSAEEYGGEDALFGDTLTRDWLLKYGCTNGTTQIDWIEDDLTSKDLQMYAWPDDLDLQQAGIEAKFMSSYFSWSPNQAYQLAVANGFSAATKPKTGIWKYADIDDAFLITIHHWMKWVKFGFTRTWDNLSIEIREGRLSRNSALEILRSLGDEEPVHEIEMFCEYLNITKKEFYSIVETFRNKEIWEFDNGKWKIKNFLIKEWVW